MPMMVCTGKSVQDALEVDDVVDVCMQGAHEVDVGERFHSAPTLGQECLAG